MSVHGIVETDNFLIFLNSFIRNLKSIRVVLPWNTCLNRRENTGCRIKIGPHVLKLINFFHKLKRTYYARWTWVFSIITAKYFVFILKKVSWLLLFLKCNWLLQNKNKTYLKFQNVFIKNNIIEIHQFKSVIILHLSYNNILTKISEHYL